MSHKSGEAHRALERLEAYHAELTRSSDRELKREIEKIIAIFKSQLFRNLCAIYDFQDDVLLNEHISFDEKVRETKRFAERWENNPPFGATLYKSPLDTGLSSTTGGGGLLDRTFDRPYTNGFHDSHSHAPTNQSSHSYTFQEQKRELTRDGWATQDYLTKTVDGPGGVQTQTTSSSNLIDSHGQEWDIVDVVIEKNQTGLGFSISGGRDRTEADHHIHVTDISPGGAVARDGRIKVNDIILKVNNVDCVDVDHQIAVDALKSSGPVVRLLVKRPKPTRSVSQSNLTDYRYPTTNAGTTGFSSFSQTVTTAPPLPVSHHHSPISSTTQQRIPIEIQRLELNPNVRKLELIKGPSGLGFSIAGGYGNQHVAGDNGIFVTRIIENSAAYYDGRIRPMDKILAVDNVIFDNVTHEFAVNTLKSTGNKVTIYYEKNPYPDYVPPPIDDSSRSITGIGMGNRSASSQQFPDQPPYGGSQSQLAYIQQPDLHPRVVTLRKGDGGLGFNIVGGEDGEPVYVSHVLPGGVADLSGNVRKGDVLLQVNDVDLRSSTHNHAALALKNCPPNTFVNLTLHYQPNEYAHFEQKVEQLRNDMLAKQAAMSGGGVAPGVGQAQRRDVYVRALFDNDPSRDAGVPHRALPFNYGDILHVVNSNDDDWWTARRVSENGDEGQEGVIPSKKRVEKREKQRRKQVNFNAGSQSLGRNASMGGGLEGRRGSRSQLSFSRKFPFVKSTEKLNEFNDNERKWGGDKGGRRWKRDKKKKGNTNFLQIGVPAEFTSTEYTTATSDSDYYLNTVDEPIFSYETVELQNINYVRPVIVLGGLKDRINDELVGRYPDRFSSCVPHTSRPPRENEVNGRDYYFVSKSDMEADVRNNMFIEAGQFQDNLYGTSIKAVRDVANAGRHCILDVSANAIKRLQNTANIYPIAILVKPQNPHQIREWDSSQNEVEAQRSFERIQRIEQNFGDLFTAVVGGYNLEDILHKIISTINEQSRQRIWVPNRQPLF